MMIGKAHRGGGTRHRRHFMSITKLSVVLGILAAVVSAFIAPLRSADARCSWSIGFPSPDYEEPLLMARATRASVIADVDTQYVSAGHGPQRVRAQIMEIERVTGYNAAAVNSALRSSGDSAVFVRVGITPACRPIAEGEKSFDRPGTYGLYSAHLRDRAGWVDGRPTFEIFPWFMMPYPDRVLSSYPADGRPSRSRTMTSDEMFDMYEALWIEDASARAAQLRTRACAWIDRHRGLANKYPAPRILEMAVGGDPREQCAKLQRPFSPRDLPAPRRTPPPLRP